MKVVITSLGISTKTKPYRYDDVTDTLTLDGRIYRELGSLMKMAEVTRPTGNTSVIAEFFLDMDNFDPLNPDPVLAKVDEYLSTLGQSTKYPLQRDNANKTKQLNVGYSPTKSF